MMHTLRVAASGRPPTPSGERNKRTFRNEPDHLGTEKI